ncbi:hypothetical protein BRADI_5g20230v3 [Brachypodium distachyon]|uniref:Uncharacterized protein n=1 Tax=Brachypodium distachyon TaxID=15368 RepID=I1J198_BRADI|nr:hypothetical protein BRADI_5g20230v3 [Brachypodium distachyon]
MLALIFIWMWNPLYEKWIVCHLFPDAYYYDGVPVGLGQPKPTIEGQRTCLAHQATVASPDSGVNRGQRETACRRLATPAGVLPRASARLCRATRGSAKPPRTAPLPLSASG